MGAAAINLGMSMKCDSCQEKATVFYTQVTDGKLKKFVLCSSCAEEKGITSPDGLLMPGEILGEAGPPVSEADIFAQAGTEECSVCGFTLESFRKVGRLGCPDCYRSFRDEISLRLPSLHKGVKHVGYFPEGVVEQRELRSKLSGLSAKLETAVLEERYEEAAALRDEIEELEREGEGVAKP